MFETSVCTMQKTVDKKYRDGLLLPPRFVNVRWIDTTMSHDAIGTEKWSNLFKIIMSCLTNVDVFFRTC